MTIMTMIMMMMMMMMMIPYLARKNNLAQIGI